MPDGTEAGDPYVLRVEGVRKRFGSNEVLTSASLLAARGEVTTLLGRNGSGKTTLLRIAAGELRPDQGAVFLGGIRQHRPRLWRLARMGLMFVPQSGLVCPTYSVGQHFVALERAFELDGAKRVVDRLGLASLFHRTASSLSGGERARLSLGLALARRPVVLLVDEPLAGIPPSDQEHLAHLLRDLAGSGTAVVTSGHDARALLSLSDTIVWSVAGTTHYLGTPSRAIEHDQFRREYLGPGFEV